ncbi:MAG TPA: ABC transporter substrate-binding protein [Jatrophihabitantaceae bacterium]|jgi:branched-chain amino acid transport system substrate-binding protein|nr:ABC transporter substrate-binding protein [Jatrophihabitantaceae bacterium]
MRFRSAICLALVLPLAAVTACSSSKAGSTATTSSSLSGSPVEIAFIANSTGVAEVTAGANTAIQAINAAGGIHGRPLKLLTCDNQLNANASAACARQFAADPNVIATVGDVDSYGSDTNPILMNAQIARIGAQPLSASDFAAKDVFPVTSGGFVVLAGAGFLVSELHAKSPGLVVIDNPSADALPGLINQVVYGPLHTKLAATATVPVSAADMAPQAAALASTDATDIALTAQLEERYIQTARQQGYAAPMVVSGTEVDPDLIKKNLAGASQNLYVMSQFNYSSDGFKKMLADRAKYEPTASTFDLFTDAYLSTEIFAKVATGLPTITRAGVFSAMSTMKGYDTDGLTEPLDFTTPGAALGGTAPRLFASTTVGYPYKYDNGAFTSAGSVVPAFGG